MPAFEKIVDAQTLEDLGKQFIAKKSSVPTRYSSIKRFFLRFRPHPMAPATYPLNVLANKMTAPIDKARDAIRFADSTSSEVRR